MTNSVEYEKFVESVLATMVGAEVYRGKSYVGRITGRTIKVDVSFTIKVAGGASILILVECKCYGHNVPVDDVEEFHSKLDDIGAQKGIIVTTMGFQSGALKAAKGRRIALALITPNSASQELSFVVNADDDEAMYEPIRPDFMHGTIYGLVTDAPSGMNFMNFSQLVGILTLDSLVNEGNA